MSDAGTPTPDAAIAKHRSGQRLNLMETAALTTEVERLTRQRDSAYAASDHAASENMYLNAELGRLRAQRQAALDLPAIDGLVYVGDLRAALGATE